MIRLIIAASFLLAACGARDATSSGDEFREARVLAMGTWVDIVIRTRGAPEDETALAALEGLLRTFEADHYPWTEGELTRINESLSRGQPATVTPEMARLLETARSLCLASNGHFDPGVGALVELWGFHSSLATPKQPTPDAIARWLAGRPSIAELVIADGTVTTANPRLKIDLGGIAKGEAVDRLVAELARRGYTDALVNAGGDLRVLGARGGRAWRIGIQSPRDTGVLGTLRLASGEAVFTSGDYERFFDTDAGRRHHLLDPSTGYPAAHTQAVTVVGSEGVRADAAATAIFVAGPEQWRQVAAALGITAVLRVDASGTIEMTDAMRGRIELSTEVDPLIVVGRS